MTPKPDQCREIVRMALSKADPEYIDLVDQAFILVFKFGVQEGLKEALTNTNMGALK